MGRIDGPNCAIATIKEGSARHRRTVIVDAVAQALRREFGADPGRMPLQAIVFSARKPP
jgi:hypothetical protein